MADRTYILNKVKETVLSFDGGAEIVLFGSQARGNAQPDSDWDFLILSETDFDYKQKREIRNSIHLIELQTGEIFSIIIHNKNYWNRAQNVITPFFKNVERESITI